MEDLRADRNALAACNAAKNSDNQEGVESTAAIETLLAQAREIITRLDAAPYEVITGPWTKFRAMEPPDGELSSWTSVIMVIVGPAICI